ncbi:MAG: transglycosylase SLT domain-containing protein, partial [Parvularculaceae bacterium]
MSAEAISNLSSVAGAHAVKTALKSASDATGAGFEILYNMARRESSLDPNAKAKTSSAAGLFQFIEQTWLAAVKKYGERHGLAPQSAAITQNAAGKFVVADAAKREGILNLRFDPAKA